MIIAGVILLIVHWLLTDAGVPVPPVLLTLIYDGGIILIVLGFILLLLSLCGIGVGRGITTVRGRRTWL